MQLKNLNAPTSYSIVGEGKGGIAGFAKGGADVKLSDADGGNTQLDYEVDAKVGGKLAALGSRLIESRRLSQVLSLKPSSLNALDKA